MKKVLIVDDETIIRFTLRSSINWEKYGFYVAKDCNSGKSALEYMEKEKVDLIITDMKMPSMSGLELIKKVSYMEEPPISIVLSGYNEFELVREAFKLGAYDYILKSNLNSENIEKILLNINESDKNYRKSKNTNNTKFELEQEYYAVVLFDVDDFLIQASRFADDLVSNMEKPMVEIAMQVIRVNNKVAFKSINPARYVMYYKVASREDETYKTSLLSLVKQIQSMWEDYINISVSAGISSPVYYNVLNDEYTENQLLLRIGVLKGKKSITCGFEYMALAKASEDKINEYESLINLVYSVYDVRLENEKQKFLDILNKMDMDNEKMKF